MSALAPDVAWLQRLQARIDQPPVSPRVPLLWQGAVIGSVEPAFIARLAPNEHLLRQEIDGCVVQGELTATLGDIAVAMRAAGLTHTWRDEQLPVTEPSGGVLGTVERAAVRPLGVTTFAVHLAGMSTDGHHWMQLRSMTKANDPGLWDTLMGGMVPATDSLQQALERETWEEAGLRIGQLRHLVHGGRIATRRPATDMAHGYVVEWIDWYRCVLPEGVLPINQDGEVERFALMDRGEVTQRLARDEFTLEAAAVLTQPDVRMNESSYGP